MARRTQPRGKHEVRHLRDVAKTGCGFGPFRKTALYDERQMVGDLGTCEPLDRVTGVERTRRCFEVEQQPADEVHVSFHTLRCAKLGDTTSLDWQVDMTNYNDGKALFRDFDLRAHLGQQRQLIEKEVGTLDENRLLNTAESDLVDYFIAKNNVEVPVLNRAQWHVESKEETVRREDYSHTVVSKVPVFYVHIPFDGEKELFRARPSTYTSSSPVGLVDGNVLVLRFATNPSEAPESIRARIDREVEQVDSHLAWVQGDVDHHNRALRGVTERAIEARKAAVLQRNGLVASLGIPVRERAGASRTFVAPAVRRKIAPTLPPATSAPFKPEPVLADEHYEHILGVLQNMTHVMERSPETFARMKEEALRDNYLVHLNGHYEGAATGETFNAGGKTDILIRSGDRNIFIAECKFWRGAKGYVATIDQLLGYSSWRDTKAAVLVFNRNRDTSKVLIEIKRETETHPNYKRTLPWLHESGFRFVMHHPTDTNRELVMTVLVFDIPGKAA